DVLKRWNSRKKHEIPGAIADLARFLELQQALSVVGLGGPLARQEWAAQLPETQKIVAASTFHGHLALQPDLAADLVMRPAKAEQVEAIKDTLDGFRLLFINYLGKVPQPAWPVVLLRALL